MVDIQLLLTAEKQGCSFIKCLNTNIRLLSQYYLALTLKAGVAL